MSLSRNCPRPHLPRRRAGGMSLIEVIVFIVVVSVALAGVLTSFNLATGTSADPLVRKQALAVAESMLEEILGKDFQNDVADPGNVSATLGCTPNTIPRCLANTVPDRQNYNDVSDYAGWNQGGVFGVDGTPVAGLGNYRVQVAVAALVLNGVAGQQVTVTVTGPATPVVLVGFRANINL